MKRYLVRTNGGGEQKGEEEAPDTGIDGLMLIEDFITPEEEAALTAYIDTKGKWSDALKRRTQHYGGTYDYKSGSVSKETAPPIPDELKAVISRLEIRNLLYGADQIIVNEYLPGQGIGAHVDHPGKFADGIASLSLLSAVTMEFTREKDAKRVRYVLPRRSLIVLHREARYDWKHGISPVKVDPLTKEERKRRVSLTFRKMIKR